MLFFESLNDIPEEQRDDYAQTEYDGKQGYQHKKVVALARAHDETKNDKRKLQEKIGELISKVEGFESQKMQEIEEAKQAAFEEARSKGDIEAIEQRYKEQLTDAVERAKAETLGEAEKQFSVSRAEDKAKLEVAEMVSAFNPVDDNARELLTLALSSKQQVTEDGKIIYTNDDGSASSLDAKGFLNSVIESDKYSLLKQANPTTKGAGVLGGQTGGSAPTTKGNTRASLEQRLANQGL